MKYSYKRIFIHNTFKHFGKKWKNGNWSVGLKIFLIAFFKNWNSFWDFKFYRKDCFFKRGLKNFEENDLYKTVDIHDDTTAKAMVLFCLNVLNAFSSSWKESYLCSIEELHWGKYSLSSLVTIGILLTSAVHALLKYLLNSLFLFPCNFFHYLPCSFSIVFVFI